MQVTVSVTGLREARMAIRRAGVEGRKILDRGVQEGASQYRDFIKRMRPVSARTTGYGVRGIPADKGWLKQQVFKRKLQMLAAGVYGGAEYDPYVQEGTRKMPARPYMEWALEDGGMKLIDMRIEQSIQELAAILLR